MTIDATTTLSDLAFIVGTALEKAGIVAVLSGGGAATVYAPDVNQSRDLDFVLGFWSSLGVSAQCVLDLGFRAKGGGYVHDETKFTLEFPPGPISIGEEVISEWETLRNGDMTLQILSPTDCVRDRLSWFLFYQNYDFSALEQALAVATRHDVELEKIRTWAIQGGASQRFEIFEARYRELA